MSTNVQMEIFEGPLDLLLHLIKKNEVSITDIPIAEITEQYLSTLELMQSLNLDLAGEFLVMASTLIHIKSLTLLPEEEGNPDEEEGEDPRDELVRRLLDYQRFKEAAEELEGFDILRRDVFVRHPETPPEDESVGFAGVSLFDLVTALRQVLERFPEEEFHEVVLEKISVREKMSQLLNDLHQKGKIIFQSLFDNATSRMEIVITFLATLELVRIRAIKISQEEMVGPIVIELAASLGDVNDRMAKEEIEGDGHGT